MHAWAGMVPSYLGTAICPDWRACEPAGQLVAFLVTDALLQGGKPSLAGVAQRERLGFDLCFAPFL